MSNKTFSFVSSISVDSVSKPKLKFSSKTLAAIMTSKKLDIITGFISVALLTSLIVKLVDVPDGIILSGLFIGLMCIVAILLGCLILTGILKLFLKKTSFIIMYSITTAICFLILHYSLYSPKMTITVPNGFVGEVVLVLSNVENNILTVDSNGIGYINEATFNNTYMEPTVIDANGKEINRNCVGFNPSTFWATGESSDGKTKIQTLSFEIVPNNKIGQKQYYSADLFKSVDKTKLK
jgi:hypothetical protein